MKSKESLPLSLLPSSPQLPGEKGGGDGGAAADGAEDASRRKGATPDSDTEADRHHRRAGAAAAQGLYQQHCPTASTAGAAGYCEQPHLHHLCQLSSR